MSIRPDHLIAELERHGVTEYRITRGKKHPRLCFQWRGREMFYVFPGTPGDNVRGDKNGVSQLRRLMGVERVPNPKSDRATKRCGIQAPSFAPPDAITVRADPMAALLALRGRMEQPEAIKILAAIDLAPLAPKPTRWQRFLAWFA